MLVVIVVVWVGFVEAVVLFSCVEEVVELFPEFWVEVVVFDVGPDDPIIYVSVIIPSSQSNEII